MTVVHDGNAARVSAGGSTSNGKIGSFFYCLTYTRFSQTALHLARHAQASVALQLVTGSVQHVDWRHLQAAHTV